MCCQGLNHQDTKTPRERVNADQRSASVQRGHQDTKDTKRVC
ncbi:hypothetical protein C882_3231 [Caenispirillum salinarum AK4]|uniref:Uncharacterized protein n=1 Tax=Caenispirillum salinarum AK4 TaxID=1238182 RepID=K9H3Q1_9PROT|nr:hypothetical protein C882_3231 [Caenispirillum salinarum AK4]